jgi:hypothetical protein
VFTTATECPYDRILDMSPPWRLRTLWGQLAAGVGPNPTGGEVPLMGAPVRSWSADATDLLNSDSDSDTTILCAYGLASSSSLLAVE